jgi:hypothetical protein
VPNLSAFVQRNLHFPAGPYQVEMPGLPQFRHYTLDNVFQVFEAALIQANAEILLQAEQQFQEDSDDARIV